MSLQGLLQEFGWNDDKLPHEKVLTSTLFHVYRKEKKFFRRWFWGKWIDMGIIRGEELPRIIKNCYGTKEELRIVPVQYETQSAPSAPMLTP